MKPLHTIPPASPNSYPSHGATLAALPALPPDFAGPYFEQELVRINISEIPKPETTGAIRHRGSVRPKLEENWQRITGMQASASAFTVVVPIHNEARLLPSLLRILNRANLPPSVSMQLVFVTNGCSDNSYELVRHFMNRISDGGASQTRGHHLLGGFADSGLNDLMQVAHFGNIDYYLLDTATASKANALNLATSIARARSDRFCICLDADTFIEPNSIPHMVADAYRHRLGEPDSNTVAVSCTVRTSFPHEQRPPSWLLRKISGFLPELTTVPTDRIAGCFWAWSVPWISAKGGIPNLMIEDLAVAAMAKLDSKSIVNSDACAWVFLPSSLRDLGLLNRRYAHGALQLKQQLGNAFDSVLPMLGRVGELAIPFTERVRHLLSQRLLGRSPIHWPKALARLLVEELWHLQGRLDYKKAPNQSSWRALKTTK